MRVLPLPDDVSARLRAEYGLERAPETAAALDSP
jgi:hypothetical protein